jgi:hypothetical protein
MSRLKVKLAISVTDRRGILFAERAMSEAFGLDLNAPANSILKAEWKHRLCINIGAFADQYQKFRDELPEAAAAWVKVSMEPLV